MSYSTNTGYTMQNGGYADVMQVSFLDLAARSVDTTSEAVELGDRASARLTLTTTAVSGTLDVTVQTSADNVTYRSAGAFTQATGATSERKAFGPLDRFVRILADLSGGGSATFSVAGELV
jgi:hypothetical protein